MNDIHLPLHILQVAGLDQPVHDPVDHATAGIRLGQDAAVHLVHYLRIQKPALLLHGGLAVAHEPPASRHGHGFQVGKVEGGGGADDEDYEDLGGAAGDGSLDALNGDERFGIAGMFGIETRMDYLVGSSRGRRWWKAAKAGFEPS
jgi:hypothetical protein